MLRNILCIIEMELLDLMINTTVHLNSLCVRTPSHYCFFIGTLGIAYQGAGPQLGCYWRKGPHVPVHLVNRTLFVKLAAQMGLKCQFSYLMVLTPTSLVNLWELFSHSSILLFAEIIWYVVAYQVKQITVYNISLFLCPGITCLHSSQKKKKKYMFTLQLTKISLINYQLWNNLQNNNGFSLFCQRNESTHHLT